MEKPVLVIMAAGMGSRYGGLKQIDPVDEYGHIIMDFSIYDAVAAGFEKVIFVIKKSIEKEFKEQIGERIAGYVQVDYVYQELSDLPEGFQVPEGREKPYGTGHAILSCMGHINGPFAVINADDYYGKQAFELMYEYLSTHRDEEKYRYVMVGYLLRNTLTENGHVARGICQEDAEGHLTEIRERTRIERREGGIMYTEDEGNTWMPLAEDSIASMNFWGFSKSMLTELAERFPKFLRENMEKNPLKCEFFLPTVVDELISEGRAVVDVRKTEACWYGVTYREDKQKVVEAIAALKAQGLYPGKLWGQSLTIEKIAGEFSLEGEVESVVSYGNGHINDTYLVTTRKGTESFSYMLQQINTSIFAEPEELMENIIGVTGHLRKKITAAGGNPERETLRVIPTRKQESFYRTPEGACYRMYVFIEDTASLEQIERPEDFYAAAEAFGNFQYLLSDYPAETLHETIPDFHNTVKRFERFLTVVEQDPVGRAGEVAAEIEFLKKRQADMGALLELMQKGEIPVRVTHNDTKLNNILLDKVTGKGICIIDLDTVMPGTSLYDFGDSIRFGANTALEDEVDLSLVSMSLELFEHYVKGYIRGCRGTLTEKEIAMLPMGAKIMTLECGMRFLTDYLEGDIYFKIHREKQNLDRCRTQLALVADMEKKWEQMTEIVKNAAR